MRIDTVLADRERPFDYMTTRAVALLGIFLASCGRRSPTIDRARELAGCQLISESGDVLAKCLVLKYSWSADSAASAMYAWQRQLDSLRREHEAQAAAVIAQQDSIRRAVIAQQDSMRLARLEPLARRAAQWVSCMLNERRVQGTNWSWHACRSLQLPTRRELDAYIIVHRLGNEEGSVLVFAHRLVNEGNRP